MLWVGGRRAFFYNGACNIYIPPAPWATGGLGVVTGKLPLTLPSPRALDPAGLDHSRVHIAFAKVYELPSESLQKCDAN